MSQLKTLQYIESTEIYHIDDTTLLSEAGISRNEFSFTLIRLGDVRAEILSCRPQDAKEIDVLNSVDALIKLHGEGIFVRFVGG